MLDFEKLKDELKNKLSNSKSSKDLEVIRVDIFCKNGFLNSEFKKLGSLSPEDKKNTSSKRPLRIISGGIHSILLAVATTNTGDTFSDIQVYLYPCLLLQSNKLKFELDSKN